MTLVKLSYNSKLVPDPGLVLQTPLCNSDLKIFENSRPSASNFKSFSRTLEISFLTVGQNNFGNKIPKLYHITIIELVD